MNDYTRRDEIRWNVIAATILVFCVSAVVLLLVTAKQPRVPDVAAQASADRAVAMAQEASLCPARVDALLHELSLTEDLLTRLRMRSVKTSDAHWTQLQNTIQAAKTLLPCKAMLADTQRSGGNQAAAWTAVQLLADVVLPDPSSDGDGPAEFATRFASWNKINPVEGLRAVTKSAAEALAQEADDQRRAAAVATIPATPPPRVLTREQAIGICAALALLQLALSYLSVRARSLARFSALYPLRDLRAEHQAGLQAAMILRLGAQRDAGFPGAVIGTAVLSLVATLALQPPDADAAVGGALLGLLVGMLAQALAEWTLAASRWRERSLEIAEVEKPVLSMVLVLGAIAEGREHEFLEYFLGLSEIEAAAVVENLAQTAEERILSGARRPGVTG